MCIEAKLQPLQDALDSYDAVRADHPASPGHYRYLPYVGKCLALF